MWACPVLKAHLPPATMRRSGALQGKDVQRRQKTGSQPPRLHTLMMRQLSFIKIHLSRTYQTEHTGKQACRARLAVMHGCCPYGNTQLVLYSAAVLPRSKCGQHLASRKNVSHMLHLFPWHAQAVHGRREECLAWPLCYTANYADGARVRDALHTVMVSGNQAYERLVWQLGFTVVEVHAFVQLAIHMHATSLLQTRLA